jgi:hypothetical protein
LYENAKQNFEQGEWGTAIEYFDLAKATKCLPEKLVSKPTAYLKKCREHRKVLRKAQFEDKTAKMESSDDDSKEAFELYKRAKRAWKSGNPRNALALLKEAQEHGLPDHLDDRAEHYIDRLEQYVDDLDLEDTATACIFDECTQNLGSPLLALGTATSTLGLSTKMTSNLSQKGNTVEMVMVLDEHFPPSSAARGKLILQLKSDVRKAMETVSKVAGIDIIDLKPSSVIVHFCFANEGNSQRDRERVSSLQKEYLRQLDDTASLIYQGTLTRLIDQKRTQTMTMQLQPREAARSPCAYREGDTITIAQIDHEEKVECLVGSMLGEGAAATVFKVTTNGKICALKTSTIFVTKRRYY